MSLQSLPPKTVRSWRSDAAGSEALLRACDVVLLAGEFAPGVTPMPMVPTQRMHSSTIHTAAASVAMKPVMMAGDAMKPERHGEARDRIPARPRILCAVVREAIEHHNQARDGHTGQERSYYGEGDPPDLMQVDEQERQHQPGSDHRENWCCRQETGELYGAAG